MGLVVAGAFAQGPAAGLFHLGAVEVPTRLPPTLGFFRDFARLFVSRLCAIGDLEERRDDVTEAMRLRSGAALADGEASAAPDRPGDWSRVIAGGWLEETLDGLRRPEGLAAAGPGAA